MGVDPEIENVIDLLVQHCLGQTKRGDLAEHKPAALVLFVEQMDLVTKRGKIACDGQGRRSGAYKCDLLAVWLERRLRHQMFDFVLVVGSDTLKTTDRYRFFIDSP